VNKVSWKTLSLFVTAAITACPSFATITACSTAAADTPGIVVDNFDGPVGSPPDPALWDLDLGPWRDDGLQTYTNSPDNVRLDGDGHLVIQARPSSDGYTSARVVTRGKLPMQFGRVSARIKFPSGQGIWPAFWLLGTDYHPDNFTAWPECGEIDIMELINNGRTYHSTLHGPQGDTDYFGGGAASGKVVGTSGPIEDLTTDFHDYWLDWRPDYIAIGVDDRTLATFTPASLPPGGQWVFNRPMYALLNIAVGGPWPGPPDATTPWPATMLVDQFVYSPTPG
jgi:beta-glucanase (GH16 family)